MSDYNEHLISQAGGDVLAGIEAHRTAMERAHRMSCSDPSDPGRNTSYGESAKAIAYLLALVREQAAKLDNIAYMVDRAEMHGNHTLFVHEVSEIIGQAS